MHRMDTFAHSEKAQSGMLLREFHIEPSSVICNQQADRVDLAGQFHTRMRCLAMLPDIVQAFLHNTVKRERGGLLQLTRNAGLNEIDR